jgi:predicted MFS family arabinose efflux permease
MIVASQLFDSNSSTLDQSLRALDAVNFLVGGALAGFGPFVALFLGGQGWSPKNVGFVLSIGGIAGLLAQIPGGELLDAARSKRLVLGLAILSVGFSALMIGLSPNFPMVLVALMLQGTTGGFIGPAIAAVSIGLVGHSALAERLGRNQRFRSAGSLAAAGLMGMVGYALSNRFIFFASALLVVPALVALTRIRAADVHFGRSVGAPDHHNASAPPRDRRATLWQNRSLMTFAACLFLFQMANASILPLIGQILVRHEGRQSSTIMAILVIVPQVLVALMAPWAGQQVESSGRRPFLLIGFGVLPIRALLFALITEPVVLVAVQVLDGISGIMIGVLQPLTIADLAGRTGRFNLAQGFVGAVSSIGASLSTTISGMVVETFGLAAGFMAVAVIALIAFGILWALMPETKPHSQ